MNQNSEFDSYAASAKAKQQFEDKNFVNFVVESSTKLKLGNRVNNSVIEKFVYAKIHFICEFCGESKSVNTVRQTSTYKAGCTADFVVKFFCDDDKKVLRVIKSSPNHQNHKISRENYSALPKQCRQSIVENEMFVSSALQMKTSIRHVQTSLNQSSEKAGNVILKDLYNYRAKMESKGNENLGEIEGLVKEMQKTPNVTVKILAKDDVVHGIYYQDGAMKLQFSHYN